MLSCYGFKFSARSFGQQWYPSDSYLGDAYKLRLPRIDQLMEFILQKGRGCLIFKKDLRQAYRQFPIDPKDYHLLGFCYDGKLYFNTRGLLGYALQR